MDKYTATEMAYKHGYEKGYDAGKRDAVKWIPVSERLPEYGQRVIAHSGGVVAHTVYFCYFWNKDYDSWQRVTHWMPLPEPPKEGE